MPQQFVEQLYKCKPVQVKTVVIVYRFVKKLKCISTMFIDVFVQVEPLFKMWKESDLATTKSRVGAIVKIWAKKREI